MDSCFRRNYRTLDCVVIKTLFGLLSRIFFDNLILLYNKIVMGNEMGKNG